MIKLTINNKPYYIPTKGNELSMVQYNALRLWALNEDAQEYDLVSALSGMDVDDAIESASIWNGRLDIESMADLFKHVDDAHAKEVTVNGEVLKPKAMELLKVSQRLLLKQIFDKVAGGEALEEHLPRVLAIGFGEQMYGKGWAGNVSLSTSIFEQQPAYIFLPVAYFFLRSACLTKKDGTLSSSLLMRHGIAQVVRKCKSLVYG